MPDLEYALEVVGGKHDGIRGMYWTDDGEHPPPDRIVIGTCTGDGECDNGTRAACRQHAMLMRRQNGEALEPSKVRHPAYWELAEGFMPSDGEKYRLTHVRVAEQGEQADKVAVYVIAGVGRKVPSEHAARERPLTVADILAAKPPAPATVAGRVEMARRLGLSVTSGLLPVHVHCRSSYHWTGRWTG